MALAPGSRLGPYEIVGSLGAGGMGEVYRARDSRLGRDVALKILPAEFSSDPARRARFEQEARAAAALSHPNIVGLYDVGTEEGVAYLVSELVAGETLTDLIQRGPVPMRRLLDIAVQISDGMAAAHSARITHRDLKPPNIMLTAEGRVKILDFGLAKQASLASASPDETMTVQQTTPGMILGTVHYMSPEQARGTPADHRSDQFSFGLILYEIVTGKKAFNKPEIVQTMSAILSEEPPPIETRVPEPLRWAIDRCLAKDPADRYESTSDLFRDLRNIRDHLSAGSSAIAPAAVPPPAPRRRIPWLLIAIAVPVLLAVFAGGYYISGPQFPDQAAYRFTPFAFEPGGQGSPVWSPDGKAVAYAARPGASAIAPYQVFVRYLDSPMPAQVTRIAEGTTQPIAWAPDGKRILFLSRRAPAGIWSVSLVGGEPESVMAASGVISATVSPDTQAVAFLDKSEDGNYGVWISAPPGAPRKRYLPDPFASKMLFNQAYLRFSPDGKHLLLLMKGDRQRDEAWLMPYPPDPSKPPELVLHGVHSDGGTPQFAWMPDSRHLVLSLQTGLGAPPQLWLADTASNKRFALTSGTAGRYSIAVSPDGHKMIFSEQRGNLDVVSVDLERAIGQRLISTERDESMPAWAAKQPLLTYVTDRNGSHEIWLHEAGGERPLVTARDFPPDTTQWFLAPSLSPEADRVIYARVDREGRAHLWISAVSGGSPVPLTNDVESAEAPGSWSPDSAWFVYLATRNGKMDLLKVKSTGQATPILVKPDVHSEVPSWSPDGNSILCGNDLLSPDGTVIRSLGNHHTDNYAFSADGKLLYGLRDEGERELLFTVDMATGSERVIGDVGNDFAARSDLHPGIRFSLAPDGKSIVYGTGKFKANLWLMEGWAK